MNIRPWAPLAERLRGPSLVFSFCRKEERESKKEPANPNMTYCCEKYEQPIAFVLG